MNVGLFITNTTTTLQHVFTKTGQPAGKYCNISTTGPFG